MKQPCKPCGMVRSYLPENIRKRLEEVERRQLEKANESRQTPKQSNPATPNADA